MGATFEPEGDAMIDEATSRAIRLEHEYTDAEILCEARRRGLFIRVEAERIVPSYIAKEMPADLQFEQTMMTAAYEAVKECRRSGKQPMGMKVDMVSSPHLGPPSEWHRRIRLALNIVVERKP